MTMNLPGFESTNSSPVTPKGKDVFLVDNVEYIEESDAYKLTYRMHKANRKHVEYYRRSVAFQINALGNMLRAAYKNNTLVKFTPAMLINAVGRQFEGEIVHSEWQGKKRANINAFSYKPVNALYSFVTENDDVILDGEPVA